MSDDGESRERGGRWGCGTSVLLIGGLAFGTLIVTIIVFVASVWGQINTNRTRVREVGEPVTIEDLHAYYRAPAAEDDTTELWLEAMAVFRTPAFESASSEMPILGRSATIPLPGEPWPELAAARQFLDDYQSALDLMHEAAERGGLARFELEFELGPAIDLKAIEQPRIAARLLALEANVRAHEGDAHAAAQSIHAMFMTARSVENQPLLITQLVRFALSGMATRELRRMLPVVDFSDEDLRQLQADLRADDLEAGVRRALIGERALVLYNYETLNADSYGLFAITRGPDRRLTLDFFEEIVAAAKLPWPEALDAANAAQAAVKKTASSGGSLYVLTSSLVPAVQAIFPAATRRIIERDAADMAVAVERFRLRHGSLPEEIEQLVPEFLPQVPIDPIDGQPLRYVVEEGEYLIFSMGEDIKDEGEGE